MTITVSGTERRTATPTFIHLLGFGFVRGLHPDAVSFGTGTEDASKDGMCDTTRREEGGGAGGGGGGGL